MAKKPSGKTKKNTAAKSSTKPARTVDPGRIIALVLIGLCLLLYGRTISYEYTFDDDIVTVKNKVTDRGLAGLGDVWSKGSVYGFDGKNVGTYRPLSLMTFAIERQLGPFNPKLSHFINVLLYTICVLLLFMVMRQLFDRKPWHVPLIITLLFLAHPVHVEVVANVKSRDEIMALLFFLLSLRLLWRYLDQNKMSLLIGSAGLYLLACLSKETAVTYALVFPLLIYFMRKESFKDRLMPIGVMAGVALLYVGWRALILETDTTAAPDLMNNALYAAEGPLQMLAANMLILGKYLLLSLAPYKLSYDYSFAEIPATSWSNVWVILSVLAHIGLGVLAYLGLKSKRPYGLGILIYFITLSITSNLFIKIASTMAERFLFSPTLGLSIALGTGLCMLLAGSAKKQQNLTPLFAVSGLVIGAFMLLTFLHTPAWQNNTSLFESGVITSPNSFRTHLNLAEHTRGRAETNPNQAARGKQFQKAIKHYNESLSIYPKNADAWYNLGVCQYGLGQGDEAARSYQKALELKPTQAMAANNLGVFYFNKKQYPQALKYFEMAAKARPGFGDAYTNIGAIYHNQGQYQQAVENYEQAIKYSPGNRNLYQNIIKAYNNLGNTQRANYYQQQLQKLR